MNQLKTLTVIILICLTFSTLSGTIVYVKACDSGSKLVFSAGASQILQAGTVSNQITIQLQDTSSNPYNALSDITVNLATNASSSGHFYSDKTGINQISGITIKEGQNSASFYYNDILAGHPTLTGSSGTLTPASTTFTINACSATKLVFSSGGSQSLSAGQISKPIVVQRQDQYGNPTTTGGSIIISLSTNSSEGTFYSDSSGTSSITSISINALASDSAGIYYEDTAAGHPTLNAVSTSLAAASTIFIITFAADGATHFAVSAPASATAGLAFSITVKAEDNYGNVVSSYVGTVHFTSSDGQAVLPANSLLSSGVQTFSVTLETAGYQTVTATDTANSAITGFAYLNVAPAGTDGIVISPKGPSIAAGETQIFTVEAFDQYGNSLGDVTSASDFSVNGVPITGNSVTETSVGSYLVTASYASETDSTTLTVTPGPLSYFTINIPVSATAGVSFTGTVTAYDAYNNVKSDYTGTVHFTSTDTATNVVLPSDHTFIASDDGAHTFTDGFTLITAGAQSITVTDGSISATALLTITANPALLDHIVISPKTSTIISGGSQIFSVEAYDKYGNDLGDITGSSTFSVNNVQITRNVVSEKIVGSYTVTATYGSLSDSTSLSVTGYTVTFTNNGLPTGTSWSVTFGNSIYSSTTSSLTISDVSAIIYPWSTATYIQVDETRYVAAQTSSGSISVPNQLSQNIDYSAQYLVTYATTGNVLPITSPADQWINSGSPATGIFTQQTINSAQTIRCNLISDNRTSIIQPTTVMATYQTQYKVIFNQTGVDSDAKGTIMTIFANTENYSQLPYTIWVNNHTKVDFTFANNIASTIANKQYTLTGTNATSPITIDMPTLIQGNYQARYSSSLFTIGAFAIVLFALILLLVLLLAWRRRKKKTEEEETAKESLPKPIS